MPTKNRKRKVKDVESSEEKDISIKKQPEKESFFERVDEDGFEESKLIAEYLPEKALHHYKIISKLINEFNCNSKDMKIYCRNYEKSQIKEYIQYNMENKKSGLMYV